MFLDAQPISPVWPGAGPHRGAWHGPPWGDDHGYSKGSSCWFHWWNMMKHYHYETKKLQWISGNLMVVTCCHWQRVDIAYWLTSRQAAIALGHIGTESAEEALRVDAQGWLREDPGESDVIWALMIRSGIILTKSYQYIGDDHYQLGESVLTNQYKETTPWRLSDVERNGWKRCIRWWWRVMARDGICWLILELNFDAWLIVAQYISHELNVLYIYIVIYIIMYDIHIAA